MPFRRNQTFKMLQVFVLLTAQLMSLTSCEERRELTLEDSCTNSVKGSVFNVEGPSSARVGEVVPFTVYFNVSSSCVRFESFDESTLGNTRIVSLNLLVQNCSPCQMYARTVPVSYQFKENKPGTYYLRFLMEDNKFLSDTITIR